MDATTTNSILVILADKTGAQISAVLAPVPHCSTLVEPLVNVIQLCEKMPCHRYLAQRLSMRSCLLMLIHKERGNHMSPERLQVAIDGIRMTFLVAQATLQRWADAGWLWTFINSNAIKRDIDDCILQIEDWLTAFERADCNEIQKWQAEFEHDIKDCIRQIEDCLTSFGGADRNDINKWQAEFERNSERDLKETNEYIAHHSQEIVNEAKKQPDIVHQVLARMQKALPNEPDNPAYDELRRNIRELQWLQSFDDDLLPDLHLNHGEVRREGEYAIDGTHSTDIWVGRYLADEKVAIKVIRVVKNGPDAIRRFQREVKVWREIWKKDGGKYIVPFYGFCADDGLYPYMVSPWIANGTAIEYVKQKADSLNYLNFIRHIANGIAVFHCHDPPVILGDINGSTIYVNGSGQPLIADFGVYQIIDDITNSAQCNGDSSWHRWRAPEVYIGEGTLSTSADIYAFSMTVLELFTHEHPYADIKRTGEICIKAPDGERPKRPTEQHVVARGLDDRLWNLLCWCWSAEPTERPTIQQVVAELSSM